MPPMIMEFFVKDKAILDGLKLGEKVDFVIEYKHPAETIVSVRKAE
ncbi:MAG: copper-binding protein [Pyrinomonadaceae bacterium]